MEGRSLFDIAPFRSATWMPCCAVRWLAGLAGALRVTVGVTLFVSLFVLSGAAWPQDASPEATARKAVDEEFVKAVQASVRSQRGLIVWVAPSPTRSALALSQGQHLVQVRVPVDTDSSVEKGVKNAPKRQRFREAAHRAGLGGRVTCDTWSSSLGYARRSVNAFLFDAAPTPGLFREAVDALQPEGVIWIRGVGGDDLLSTRWPNATLQRFGDWHWGVKPRPSTLDTWTHVRHDASRNAVSRDQEVASPQRLKWVGGNLWPRGYRRSAVQAVTVGSRQMVYVLQDETPEFDQLTRRDSLVARDAFNGLPLWKVPAESYRIVMSGERVFTSRMLKSSSDRLALAILFDALTRPCRASCRLWATVSSCSQRRTCQCGTRQASPTVLSATFGGRQRW